MRTVQVSYTANGVELYFPPMRMPEVAVPLAAFGALCALIPGVLMLALSSVASDASGLLSATLMGGFALPFVIFGGVFVLLAVYMVANALIVRVEPESVSTARLLFGVIIKHRRIVRADIASIEPEIASRYQSMFSSDPVYHLVARATDRSRTVVGETLRGTAEMERIRALIENPSAASTGSSAA